MVGLAVVGAVHTLVLLAGVLLLYLNLPEEDDLARQVESPDD
jgi:hypothetical protein